MRPVVKPGTQFAEATKELGKFLRDVMKLNDEIEKFSRVRAG